MMRSFDNADRTASGNRATLVPYLTRALDSETMVASVLDETPPLQVYISFSRAAKLDGTLQEL